MSILTSLGGTSIFLSASRGYLRVALRTPIAMVSEDSQWFLVSG